MSLKRRVSHTNRARAKVSITGEKCAGREYNTRSRARIAPHSSFASFDVPHSLKDVGVSRNEMQQIVPAVLDEVKERAVVDKPITEAEVVALLEASH